MSRSKGKLTDFNKQRSKEKERVKVFDQALHYIKYSILKETGQEINIDLLRLCFRYFTEYLINQLNLGKVVAFLNVGVFDTRMYPDSIKKDAHGHSHYVPAFEAPVLRFSKVIRESLKSGDPDCTSPEFLEAKAKDYNSLYEIIRPRTYGEFNIPEPPDESDLDYNEEGDELIFYTARDTGDKTIRIDV